MQSLLNSSSPSSKTRQQSLVKKPFKFKLIQTGAIKDEENKRITSSDHKSMATLQRFKLLATQCGVAQSPTRSPRTSPVVHLRRRRSTLRSMLLGRRNAAAAPPRRRDSVSSLPERRIEKDEEEKALVKRNSLKELFGSASQSPPWEVEGARGRRSFVNENRESSPGFVGVGLAGLRNGLGSPRPVWTGFRYRSLLRRAWRPVLVTIPE